MTGVVVVGLGNRWRRDDAVGPEVASRVRAVAPAGLTVVEAADPSQLLELWAGTELAVVIDAARPNGTPGRITVVEGDDIGRGPATASSHGLGIGDAIALSRVVGNAPDRVVVIAVEAAAVEPGLGLSLEVEAAAAGLVQRLVADRCALRPRNGGSNAQRSEEEAGR